MKDAKNKAEALHEEWEENEVQLPKIPFMFITLYQSLFPLSIIIALDYILLYFFSYIHLFSLIEIILIPILFILNSYLSIFLLSKFSRWLNKYYEKKSPPKEGTFARSFKNGDIENPSLQYYHRRGFVYKWPVWVAKKSIFPWMINFILRDMSDNIIDNDFMYGDAFVGLEMTKLESGGVIMEGGIISSHIVDSIYGNLTIKKAILGENAIISANSIATPGVEIHSGKTLGPNAFAPKNTIIDDSEAQLIWGIPAKKKSYQRFLDKIPEAMKNEWQKKLKKLEKQR
jgi:acetyltransferase-like isoleucine patch superfamily enzyme